MSLIPIRVNPTIHPHIASRGRRLEPDNPLTGRDCPVCGAPLGEGPLSLVLVGRGVDAKDDPWLAAGVLVHSECGDDDQWDGENT